MPHYIDENALRDDTTLVDELSRLLTRANADSFTEFSESALSNLRCLAMPKYEPLRGTLLDGVMLLEELLAINSQAFPHLNALIAYEGSGVVNLLGKGGINSVDAIKNRYQVATKNHVACDPPSEMALLLSAFSVGNRKRSIEQLSPSSGLASEDMCKLPRVEEYKSERPPVCRRLSSN